MRVRSGPLRRGRVAAESKLRSRAELSSNYGVAVPRAKRSLGQKLRSRAELSQIYDVAVLRDETNMDKSWSPVRCFRQFIGARLLLLRQNCAPARSFLQFMGLRCLEIKQILAKVGLPSDAFDNLQVLGLSWLLGAWALEFRVPLSISILIMNC